MRDKYQEIGQDEIDEIMPKINGKPLTKSTFNDTSYYLSSTESNEKGVFYYMTGAQTIYTLPAIHPISKDGLEYYYVMTSLESMLAVFWIQQCF